MSTHADYLQPYLNNNPILDKSKLTPEFKKIVEYVKRIFPNVIEDTIVISLCSVLGQIGSYNKLKIRSHAIKGKKRETFANFYGLTFMPSGEGKDVIPEFLLNTLMEGINQDFMTRREQYMDTETQKVIDTSQEKYAIAKGEGEKYVENNKPRYLNPVATDGTVEGLVSMREAFERATFGGVTIRISEFGDYIKSDNAIHKDFISAIVEIFDNGSSKIKLTKGEKRSVEVKDVPGNFLAHSSFYGLLDGNGNQRLLEFFNRGLARRSYICYPQIGKYNISIDESEDPMERIVMQKKGINPLTEVDQYIQKFSYVYECGKTWPVFTFDEDAETYLQIYTEYNSIRTKGLSILTEEGFRAELKSRQWKMMKLAGIIASLEHPEDFKVHLEDLGSAIYITEFFGEHFQRFYMDKPQSSDLKLLEYFIENKDKWITKSDIREQKFVGENSFSHWINDAILYVEEKVQSKGFKFREDKNGSRGKKYMVEDLNPIK